jgi:hypothetical protein
MDVLLASESSGKRRDAFRKKGHNAWSCGVRSPDDDSPFYIQGDVLTIIQNRPWDLILCCFVCKHPEMIDTLTQLDCKWCLENPIGDGSSIYRQKPDQIIQPYNFGHDAKARIGLWLHNLHPLTKTKYVAARTVYYEGKMHSRWSNQTDYGEKRTSPEKIYEGIGQAMANQWG